MSTFPTTSSDIKQDNLYIRDTSYCTEILCKSVFDSNLIIYCIFKKDVFREFKEVIDSFDIVDFIEKNKNNYKNYFSIFFYSMAVDSTDLIPKKMIDSDKFYQNIIEESSLVLRFCALFSKKMFEFHAVKDRVRMGMSLFMDSVYDEFKKTINNNSEDIFLSEKIYSINKIYCKAIHNIENNLKKQNKNEP